MKKKPTKITPDPIIDAVVEFRFESDIPPDAILGMVFSVVRNDFQDFSKLPIAEIPDEIRRSDPQLKYAPYYQSTSSSYRLNVGPNVISISNPGEYTGWKDNFFPFIKKILKQIETADVIKAYSRIGLRYIDFFNTDIFENITLSITFNNNPLVSKQTTISTLFEQKDLITRVQIQNNTTVNLGSRQDVGSIIDSDTFYEPNGTLSYEKVIDIVDKQHEESLNIFFSLLKPEFIEKLNPEYDDE